MLAGFLTILGMILGDVFIMGIIASLNNGLIPILLIPAGMIFVGIIMFKFLGYSDKEGFEAALENLPWAI